MSFKENPISRMTRQFFNWVRLHLLAFARFASEREGGVRDEIEKCQKRKLDCFRWGMMLNAPSTKSEKAQKSLNNNRR